MSDDQTTAEALLAAGYREYPVPDIERYDRLFQKRFDSDLGAMYFINFHEWRHAGGRTTFEAQLCCDTATGGYVWITIREDGIGQTEARAAMLWSAAGSVYYEPSVYHERI